MPFAIFPVIMNSHFYGIPQINKQLLYLERQHKNFHRYQQPEIISLQKTTQLELILHQFNTSDKEKFYLCKKFKFT